MISHEHRCVFVHIPKCAGQSVEAAFLEDLGLTWETRAVLLLRQNDRPTIGPLRLAHLIARDYTRHHYLSHDLFTCYTTFAVVRNPWARAVSIYRYLDANESFSDFIENRLTQSLAAGEMDTNFWFFRPQIDYVTDAHGKIIVDRILNFENLGDEFERLSAEIGLKTKLRHVNKSKPGTIRRDTTAAPISRYQTLLTEARRTLATARRRIGAFNKRTTGKSWRDFYNEHTHSKVAALYADDIERFGYSFDQDDAKKPKVG
jgi:hypothetical protein